MMMRAFLLNFHFLKIGTNPNILRSSTSLPVIICYFRHLTKSGTLWTHHGGCCLEHGVLVLGSFSSFTWIEKNILFFGLGNYFALRRKHLSIMFQGIGGVKGNAMVIHLGRAL